MFEHSPSANRLEGWEQIAYHLNVTKRQAQRWEVDLGLPVHREGRQKKAKVFALPVELEAWRRTRHIPPPASTNREVARVTRWKGRARFAFGVLAALSAMVTIYFVRTRGHWHQDPVRIGRLFARSTSEGHSPARIRLTHEPGFLAISPDGEKLFAAPYHGRVLSIVNTSSHSVQTVVLQHDVSALAVSQDRLYVGSLDETVTMVDIAKGEILHESVSVGGPVWDIAITPDNEKLFMAMDRSGVKRLLVRTGKLDQVSVQVCPENLALDRDGKRLYVAYQCSGPGGRLGHDSIEIFDVDKETSVDVISGPPIVGGRLSVSLDGKLVLIDGKDACFQAKYDHIGCGEVNNYVFHILRSSDRRVLSTFGLDESTSGIFIDDTRLLMFTKSTSIIDVTRSKTLEQWDTDSAKPVTAIFDYPKQRAYLGSPAGNGIVVLEVEPAKCSSQPAGLAMLYPGDGTADDAVGITSLKQHGDVRFVPGRVGQAFFLNDNAYLSESWTSNYCLFDQNSTLALYVKVVDVGKKKNVLYWIDSSPLGSIRLLISDDGHFVLQTEPKDVRVTSKTVVKPSVWYHVVATNDGQGTTLYINGEAEGHGAPVPHFHHIVPAFLLLGARSGQPAFHGWLDEIAFYGRALTPAEVKALYQLRESGPCKL